MDAAGGLTTAMLKKFGIKNHIHRFTNNRRDWEAIPTASNSTKKCEDAKDVYARLKNRACVIHDGTQVARNTIPYVRIILLRRLQKIIRVCNISTRDKQYGHNTFLQDVCKLARRHGYKVAKSIEMPGYNQGGGPMKPFMFVFERRARVVIDLTGED